MGQLLAGASWYFGEFVSKRVLLHLYLWTGAVSKLTFGAQLRVIVIQRWAQVEDL